MFNLAWFCSCFLNVAMCDWRDVARIDWRRGRACIRVLGESRDEDDDRIR